MFVALITLIASLLGLHAHFTLNVLPECRQKLKIEAFTNFILCTRLLVTLITPIASLLGLHAHFTYQKLHSD